MTGRYDEDLAFIHDAGFGALARRAAPGLKAILREHGVRTGHVVDLGCGSGLLAAELIASGYDVTGIDASAAMLDIARRRAPAAVLRRVSFFRAAVPDCDAVTATGECFNYVPGTREGLRSLDRLFARIADALRPGGVLVFDVLLTGRGSRVTSRAGELSGPGWSIAWEVEEHPSRKAILRRISTARRAGGLSGSERRRTVTHEQRTFTRSEMSGLLRAAGFRVRTHPGYGRFVMSPTHAVFVARRP